MSKPIESIELYYTYYQEPTIPIEEGKNCQTLQSSAKPSYIILLLVSNILITSLLSIQVLRYQLAHISKLYDVTQTHSNSPVWEEVEGHLHQLLEYSVVVKVEALFPGVGGVGLFHRQLYHPSPVCYLFIRTCIEGNSQQK